MNLLTRIIDHDNDFQTSYRHTNFGSTECKISYCVDYVFCGQMSRREERGQDQHRWYCTGPTGIHLIFIMCGHDVIIKLRSLISPSNLIYTPYKDVRLAIQKYISLKERVLTAERAKFLDDFLERLREEARYRDFKKNQNSGQT